MDSHKNLIMALAVLVFVLTGCADFLDKKPLGVESSTDFLKTESQALLATTAVYDATGWRFSQEIFEWFLGDVVSDDAEKGGENAADWAELQQLKDFRGNAANSISFGRWNEFYQGIYRANIVIEGVPDIDMDPELRARLVGEAKYLRGFFYFQLVKTFGAVPLITKRLNPSEYCQARSPIEACWAQIEMDLDDASKVLPEKSAYPASDVGRATKGAADALLAKAYIFQSKWAEAMARSAIVIQSGEYDLETNYGDNFKSSHENGIESIFEIQHAEFATSAYGDLNEGQETSIYQGNRNATFFTGWGFNCPTQNFVDEFELNDPRKKATVVFNNDLIYEGTPAQQKADNSASPTGYSAKKYVLEYQPDKPEISNSSPNWRSIRFADVLLFHAEAANEVGNSTLALESLNKVRRRVSMPAVTVTDKLELRNAIYHERRVELGLEGHRFFDLVRQGRAAGVLAKNGFIAGKHEYFPIPQLELDVCSKIVQNPY